MIIMITNIPNPPIGEVVHSGHWFSLILEYSFNKFSHAYLCQVLRTKLWLSRVGAWFKRDYINELKPYFHYWMSIISGAVSIFLLFKLITDFDPKLIAFLVPSLWAFTRSFLYLWNHGVQSKGRPNKDEA